MTIRESDHGRGAEMLGHLETRKDKWEAVLELNNADMLDAFEVALTWPSPPWDIIDLLRTALQSRLDMDCETCGVSIIENLDHILPGHCPVCQGDIHVLEDGQACAGWYADPKTCTFHESADDDLQNYEGADSPAGIRYHEGEEIDRGADFDG